MAMENIFKNTWKKFYTLIYNVIDPFILKEVKKINRSKLLKTFSCPI
jgi:hypothetical protein